MFVLKCLEKISDVNHLFKPSVIFAQGFCYKRDMCTKQLLDIQIIQTGMKLNNLDGGGGLKYYFTINQNLIQSLEECKERSFLIEIFNIIKIKTGIYRKQQEHILQIFWFSLAHFRNILKNDSFGRKIFRLAGQNLSFRTRFCKELKDHLIGSAVQTSFVHKQTSS